MPDTSGKDGSIAKEILKLGETLQTRDTAAALDSTSGLAPTAVQAYRQRSSFSSRLIISVATLARNLWKFGNNFNLKLKPR
jgi:hypothetical protein